MTTPPPITSFSREFRFLSNFWAAPVYYEAERYPTVEHAFQAAKTLDPNWRKKIGSVAAPGEAKRLGRMVPLRPDWEAIKRDVMLLLLRQKFGPHTTLGEYLRQTHPRELIEGNHWGDQYWGVCDGVGENHLGIILMAIRAELVA